MHATPRHQVVQDANRQDGKEGQPEEPERAKRQHAGEAQLNLQLRPCFTSVPTLVALRLVRWCRPPTRAVRPGNFPLTSNLTRTNIPAAIRPMRRSACSPMAALPLSHWNNLWLEAQCSLFVRFFGV